MQKTDEFEDSHILRSGKRYKVDCRGYYLEYPLSISESVKSNLEASKLNPSTPERTLGTQGNPTALLSGISSNQTPPSGQKTPTSQQTKPPHKNAMADDIKIPIFRGTGLEDPDQHGFLCEVVWNVKQVANNNVKMAQLTTTFRDRALNWFMKYTDEQARTLVEVKTMLIVEFKKPK